VLVSGWRGGIGWTRVVGADHREGETGEKQDGSFTEQAKGLCGPQEEALGIRGWRSRVLEGDPNHGCGLSKVCFNSWFLAAV